MQIQIPPQEAPPACFGQSWDSRDVMCAGGADAAFRAPNGSHIRPACDFYNPCGARVAAARLEQTRLIPPQNIVRAPTATAPVPVSGQMTSQQMQQAITAQAQSMYQQMLQHQQAGGQRFVPWNQQQATVPTGFQQMMPVNYVMPPYLTVQEPVIPGESAWGSLLRAISRSIGKSVGHTISHFFDSVMWRQPPPPQ